MLSMTIAPKFITYHQVATNGHPIYLLLVSSVLIARFERNGIRIGCMEIYELMFELSYNQQEPNFDLLNLTYL